MQRAKERGKEQRSEGKSKGAGERAKERGKEQRSEGKSKGAGERAKERGKEQRSEGKSIARDEIQQFPQTLLHHGQRTRYIYRAIDPPFRDDRLSDRDTWLSASKNADRLVQERKSHISNDMRMQVIFLAPYAVQMQRMKAMQTTRFMRHLRSSLLEMSSNQLQAV